MLGMVPDNNILGHFRVLLGHLDSPAWQDLWRRLDIQIHSFESLGLLATATDREIWQKCQQAQVILITANRNEDGPDSLETTIRDSNAPESLPIFTLANVDRIRLSSAYAEQVAEQLIDRLMNLENIRGAGRIWLP
jgi:Domain of unknown function (DUF5615)